MKFDIKKYLSLGAVLAASVAFVSCEGDDGDDGRDGQDGQDGVGNNGGVFEGLSANGAPARDLLPLGEFKLTIDTATGALGFFETGDQLVFDVDTLSLYEYSFLEDGDSDFDVLSQLGDWDTSAVVAGEPTFVISSIDLNADDDDDQDTDGAFIDQIIFTPTAASQGSQTGNFVFSTTPDRVRLDKDTGGQNDVVLTGAPAGAEGSRTQNGISVFLTAGDDATRVSSSAVPSDLIIVGVDDQATGLSRTFLVNTGGSLDVSAGNFNNPASVEINDLDATGFGNIGAGETREVVVSLDGIATLSGVYRFDLDSSVGSQEPIINVGNGGSQAGNGNADSDSNNDND